MKTSWYLIRVIETSDPFIQVVSEEHSKQRADQTLSRVLEEVRVPTRHHYKIWEGEKSMSSKRIKMEFQKPIVDKYRWVDESEEI